MFTVYKIINTTTGKYYVGYSGNYANRIKSHFNQLRNQRHHSKELQAAFNNGDELTPMTVAGNLEIGEAKKLEYEIINTPDSYNVNLKGVNYCFEPSFETAYHAIKQSLQLSDNEIAQAFGFSSANSFRASSSAARNRRTFVNIYKLITGKIKELM